MRTVTVLEFRKETKKILRWARQGQRMIMTYRGKPVCRIEPIDDAIPSEDDPFYRLGQMADVTGRDLNNEEIDRIIYES